MKKTKMTRSLLAACSIVALSAVMYGCVHSGDGAPAATALSLSDAQMGQELPAGRYNASPELVAAIEGASDAALEAAAGEHATGDMITLAGLDFSCVSGPCSVTVAPDGSHFTTTGTIMVMAHVDPVDPVDPVPTPTEQAGTDAQTAADNAKTAADNAKQAAEDADTARTNAATMQTDESSSGLAKKARDAADKAKTAADDAQTAADAAAAAANGVAAGRALGMAEDARDAAMGHETDAGNYGQMAEDAAGGELKIDDTMKSVGGTTIDAKAKRSVVTIGEGTAAQTTDTGLQAKANQPMTTGPQTAGRVTVQGDPDADPDPFMSPVANAAARTFPIGKLVDEANDMARLMIVTSYAGTKTVRVFAIDSNATDLPTTTGTIQVDGAESADDATDDVFSSLKSRGDYYPAGDDGTLITADPADDGTLAGDTIAFNAKPREVFSYVSGAGTDTIFGTKDDETSYVVLQGESTDPLAGTTTKTYRPVDIHIDTNADGDPDTPVVPMEVTAVLPDASNYEHIHFGVWAALDEAAKNGRNDIDGLGIGFVQILPDGSTTGADMPNNGTGTYAGDWVATIQAADPEGDGDVILTNGMASLDANFGKGEITADLQGLAMLEGEISTNTFMGTMASDIAHATLDSNADFEGTFSGGFFGVKADEAGGIFDFATEGNEGGAFVGAFGAGRTDNK